MPRLIFILDPRLMKIVDRYERLMFMAMDRIYVSADDTEFLRYVDLIDKLARRGERECNRAQNPPTVH
jgi:hypothetical protein